MGDETADVLDSGVRLADEPAGVPDRMSDWGELVRDPARRRFSPERQWD